MKYSKEQLEAMSDFEIDKILSKYNVDYCFIIPCEKRMTLKRIGNGFSGEFNYIGNEIEFNNLSKNWTTIEGKSCATKEDQRACAIVYILVKSSRESYYERIRESYYET